jgi:signal transduction histidine kinase
MKDLFTDILRHDLLGPASVVKGYTELLLDTMEKNDGEDGKNDGKENDKRK